MFRPTFLVECVDFQLAEIDGITRRPDNRGDTSLRNIQLENEIGDAIRVRSDLAGIQIFRQLKAVATFIGVGNRRSRRHGHHLSRS